MRRRFLRSRRGMTAIEMVMAVALLAILTAGFLQMFVVNKLGAVFTPDAAESMQSVRSVLDTMAKYAQPGIGFAATSPSGGLHVTINNSVWYDYLRTSGALTLSVSGGTATTVLPRCSAFTLTYYKSLYDSSTNTYSWATTTTLSEAQAVDVTVTQTMADSAMGSVTRTTRIVLRNKSS
jgi:prepilin-type N-terminal cleavage/methylation domain-containing protein